MLSGLVYMLFLFYVSNLFLKFNVVIFTSKTENVHNVFKNIEIFCFLLNFRIYSLLENTKIVYTPINMFYRLR